MADNKAVGAPALDTNIESGRFDEKRTQQQQQQQYHSEQSHQPRKAAGHDDDEDEDIDALIEDLESQDGHGGVEEEEEENTPGGGRLIPEDMLQTDSRVGLTESEVTSRRRKYGLNQMKEEKENLFLKFLSYFVGPIQFVMEVSLIPNTSSHRHRGAPAFPPLAFCIKSWPLGPGQCSGNGLGTTIPAPNVYVAAGIFRAFFSECRRLRAPLELWWAGPPASGLWHWLGYTATHSSDITQKPGPAVCCETRLRAPIVLLSLGPRLT